MKLLNLVRRMRGRSALISEPLISPEDVGFQFVGGDGNLLTVGENVVFTQPWFGTVFYSEARILSRPWSDGRYVTVWMDDIKNGVRGKRKQFCAQVELLGKNPLPVKIYDPISGFGIDRDAIAGAKK